MTPINKGSKVENCDLLVHYAASSGNSLQTFRGNLSVPYSRVKMGPIGYPATLVRNYHRCGESLKSRKGSLVFKLTSSFKGRFLISKTLLATQHLRGQHVARELRVVGRC